MPPNSAMPAPYSTKMMQDAAMKHMCYYAHDLGYSCRKSSYLTVLHCIRLPPMIRPRTIAKWYNHYMDMGLLPAVTASKHGRKWRTHGISNQVYTDEEFSILELHLDKEPIMYLDEMIEFMKVTFGKPCSISCMSKLLIRKGLTRKKVYEKASQAIQLRKDLFVSALRSTVTDPEMVVFLDESSKDRLAARRVYGYSKGGKRAHYKCPFNMDVRYTLMGAADCYGFVRPMCDVIKHKVEGKVVSNTCDGAMFVEYIRTKVAPLLGNYLLGEPHSVVVMDNCSIHMRAEVEALISQRGAILIYSAPYSPELIPIEAMFKQWKDYLRRHHVEFGKDWSTVHQMALSSVTPLQGLNYFKMTTLVELVEDHPLLRNTGDEDDEALLLISCLI